MSERYFETALRNFTADAAYVGAVRHLHDLGLSVPDIVKNCLYPVSEEKVLKVIEDYEKEKNSPEAEFEFVQETDEFGRRSFRKVVKPLAD